MSVALRCLQEWIDELPTRRATVAPVIGFSSPAYLCELSQSLEDGTVMRASMVDTDMHDAIRLVVQTHGVNFPPKKPDRFLYGYKESK